MVIKECQQFKGFPYRILSPSIGFRRCRRSKMSQSPRSAAERSRNSSFFFCYKWKVTSQPAKEDHFCGLPKIDHEKIYRTKNLGFQKSARWESTERFLQDLPEMDRVKRRFFFLRGYGYRGSPFFGGIESSMKNRLKL